MDDTLEKRVQDLEVIRAHIPEDLDARFAGVDSKFADIREILVLHTTRFSKIDRRLDGFDARVAALEKRLDHGLESVDGRLAALEKQLQGVVDGVRQLLERKP